MNKRLEMITIVAAVIAVVIGLSHSDIRKAEELVYDPLPWSVTNTPILKIYNSTEVNFSTILQLHKRFPEVEMWVQTQEYSDGRMLTEIEVATMNGRIFTVHAVDKDEKPVLFFQQRWRVNE